MTPEEWTNAGLALAAILTGIAGYAGRAALGRGREQRAGNGDVGEPAWFRAWRELEADRRRERQAEADRRIETVQETVTDTRTQVGVLGERVTRLEERTRVFVEHGCPFERARQPR